MRRLDGKVAFVAGGAGGIGTATCRRLAAEGARVCVADVDEEGVTAVVDAITASRGEAIGLRLDLADGRSIAAAFAQARERMGWIELLHCNGAMTGPRQLRDGSVLDVDLETWNLSLAVNLTGFLLCTQAALPDMLAHGRGAIVYTSSGAAWVPDVVRVAYGVSKAGVNHLMRHVANLCGKKGVRANAIAPGLVLTPATRRLPPAEIDGLLAAGRSPRLGEPEDIAAMVALLFSDDGGWINGQTIAVDGGLTLRQ